MSLNLSLFLPVIAFCLPGFPTSFCNCWSRYSWRFVKAHSHFRRSLSKSLSCTEERSHIKYWPWKASVSYLWLTCFLNPIAHLVPEEADETEQTSDESLCSSLCFLFVGDNPKRNAEELRLQGTSGGCLILLCSQSRLAYSSLLGHVPSWDLSISANGSCKNSLGNLVQCLTTIMVKKKKKGFLCWSRGSLPFVPALDTTVRRLAVSSYTLPLHGGVREGWHDPPEPNLLLKAKQPQFSQHFLIGSVPLTFHILFEVLLACQLKVLFL